MMNYIIFTVSFFLSFVNFMIFYSYPFRLEELGFENSTAGIVVGVATIFTLLMRIVSGILVDRFRFHWAIFITALLYSGALILINIDQYLTVIIGRLALGALLGIMSTLLMYYSLIKSENSEEKSKNVSMITFFNVMPTCLAPFISLKITQHWGGSTVAQVGIILFIICLVFSFILDLKTSAIGGKSSAQEINVDIKSSVIFKHPSVVSSLTILALVYVISGTTVTFLPIYLIQSGIKDPSGYFLVFTVCMMLPRLLLKKYMPKDSNFPFFFLGICTVFSLLGTVSNFYLANGYLVLLGAVFCGTTLGLIYPTVMSYVVCCFKNNLAGTSSSMVAAAADFGVIVSNLGLALISAYFSEKTAMALPILTSCMALVLLAHRASVRNISKMRN